MKHEYNLNGTVLSETTVEKDLGVHIDNQLKFSQHINGIVAKANRMIGLIKISFESVDKEMFLNLYKTLIHPLLEYCVQAWSPHLQKYINLLENVQRRATRIVREVKNLDYDERLNYLELPKLEDRRIRGDMILTYRLINGKEGIDYQKFFSLEDHGYDTRGHNMKISKPGQYSDPRLYGFSYRVIDVWNDLTPGEVNAASTSVFRKLYDEQEEIRQQIKGNSIYQR